jgi:histone-lysine N-methyltransferase SETD1
MVSSLVNRKCPKFYCFRLNPKDIVIEYVGEKIRVPVADCREERYEKIGVGDCYLFMLDPEHIIDATFYGNKARYINHSCDPNLKSEKIVVDGKTHIIFTANRHIEKDEELTFDYQFEYEENKIECFCGASACMGRLN